VKITEIEFNQLMEEVDKDFQEESVEIHARPLHAVGKVVERLWIADPVPLTLGIPNKEDFRPEVLYSQIHNWYERRYGKRLQIHMGPGSIAILIRGEAWEIELPPIFGSVKLVCDPCIERYRDLPRMVRSGEIPVYNVLLAIKNLSEDLARSLSVREQEYIFKHFRHGLNALQTLLRFVQGPFIREALIDLESAVNNLVDKHPHYGVSKWSSLQFTEKIIKSKLQQHQIIFPTTHRLSRLAGLYNEKSLGEIDLGLLNKIQCSAGVRYGEEEVSWTEAIEAHHSSIKVLRALFPMDSFKFKF